MTDKEKIIIGSCRIRLTGPRPFCDIVMNELTAVGFADIEYVPSGKAAAESDSPGISVDCGGGLNSSNVQNLLPAILPFDFISGAGVIVIFREDDREFIDRPDLRPWAAEYMAGYCSFWNIGGIDWLLDALPAMRAAQASEAAMRTAARMSARIAANIAAGREVKQYPRFYLAENWRGN